MRIENLTLSFGTQEIFNDISLTIKANEKVGIVGVNGSGKTTLFKIVTGVTKKGGTAKSCLNPYK
ncbi:MAG: ATP-binding cassette domain-containing protein [Bacilli bacterium]|jgi:ATPase subunit of ABC transporter with duplicated ATPase domains